MLSQAALFLFFAIITVPIAKKFKLGSVLGYLLAGILIGPLFGLIGSEVSSIQHFAELGVVMMMFLIGLELKPKEIWHMKSQLLGLGGMQIVLTTILLGLSTHFIFRFELYPSIALGLIFSLSSTAIVLQSLQETKQLNTKAGKSILSVLISQDIAVIPIFAILPMLVISSTNASVANRHLGFMASLPGYVQALVILAVIILMIFVGKYILRYVFRYVAKTKLVELFTALVLLLIIAVSLTMESLGLSAALGTFIAGVILSESEYRHEIESQISPFKGLLMGVFFISIGASINFVLFAQNWIYILVAVLLLICIKIIILALLAKVYRLKTTNFWLFSLSLAQGSEFAFVLLGFALTLGLFQSYIVSIAILVIILSMLLTPIIFLIYERVILVKYQNKQNMPNDTIAHQSNIIIAGAGRFGQIIARVLNANQHEPVILDYDIDMVETFRKYGNTAYYGNALLPEVLISAGIMNSTIFVAALDDRDSQTELVAMVRRHEKNIKIIARARDRHHAYELEEAGANYVIRETFESASTTAIEALIMLGDDKDIATQKVNIFKAHDIESMKKLKQEWLENGTNKDYIDHANTNKQMLAALMAKSAKD